MDKSEDSKDLFAALSKFQGELDNATKGPKKQGLTYQYADLAACINAAKPHLLNNGLAVIQLLGMNDNKHTITTMLTHSSGQYISSESDLPQAVLHGSGGKNPVQVVGSAITYMRRYCFAAITGMAQEDDDGGACASTKVKQSPDANDMSWINAAKLDKNNLSQIEDPVYRARIELFIKEGF